MAVNVFFYLVFYVGSVTLASVNGFTTHRESSPRIDPLKQVDCDPSCTCGVSGSSRIVGGEIVSPKNKYPWITGLCFGSCGSSQSFCGGSLINSCFVLTAAHCVQGLRATDLGLTIGDHTQLTINDINTPNYRSAKRIIIHPGYNSVLIRHDMALIELDVKIQMGGSALPVCLPPPDNPAFLKEEVTIAGWGTLSSGGSSTPVQLREVTVLVVKNELCNQLYGSILITEHMICAGIAEGGKDSCQGDSGGPLTHLNESMRHEQVGVVSFGIGCGIAKYPGVYARVGSYLKWIADVTSGSDCLYCSGMAQCK